MVVWVNQFTATNMRTDELDVSSRNTDTLELL